MHWRHSRDGPMCWFRPVCEHLVQRLPWRSLFIYEIPFSYLLSIGRLRYELLTERCHAAQAAGRAGASCSQQPKGRYRPQTLRS